MKYFRNYNLIDLIENTQFQAECGTAREYLEWFSPEVRSEVIVNFNPIATALLSRARKERDRAANSKLL